MAGLFVEISRCYTAQNTAALRERGGSMYKSIEKVISEYVFAVGNLEFRIKGRISEKLGAGLGAQQPYSWAVSHYYKLSKDAPSVTLPPKTECGSKEEAERLLFNYARGFTEFVEPNKFF